MNWQLIMKSVFIAVLAGLATTPRPFKILSHSDDDLAFSAGPFFILLEHTGGAIDVLNNHAAHPSLWLSSDGDPTFIEILDIPVSPDMDEQLCHTLYDALRWVQSQQPDWWSRNGQRLTASLAAMDRKLSEPRPQRGNTKRRRLSRPT